MPEIVLGRKDLVPRIVFYVYTISIIILFCISLTQIGQTLVNIPTPTYLKLVSTTLSLFSTFLITYIFYIALRYIKLHRLRLNDFVSKAEIIVSDKISEVDATNFKTALEIVGSRVRRLPKRVSPPLLSSLVSILYVIGLVTVESVSRYLYEVTPEMFLEFPLSSETLMEFFTYMSIMGIGSILLLVSTILCFYILHILNRDLYEIESIEEQIASSLRPIASKADLRLPYREFTTSRRNTVLYIILYLLTLGLFSIYWVYRVAIKDIEEHTKEDSRLYSEISKILLIRTH